MVPPNPVRRVRRNRTSPALAQSSVPSQGRCEMAAPTAQDVPENQARRLFPVIRRVRRRTAALNVSGKQERLAISSRDSGRA